MSSEAALSSFVKKSTIMPPWFQLRAAAAGLLLAQRPPVVPNNNHPQGAFLKNEGDATRQNATKETAAGTIRLLEKRTIQLLILGAFVGVYAAYPVSLLCLFRVSEQISWLRLFEHNHYCVVTGDYHHCRQLYAIHLVLTSSFFANSWMIFHLFKHKSQRKRAGAVCVGLLFLGLGIFKYSVDHSLLYNPEHLGASDILQGKVAVVTGANRGIGFATARSLARMGAHVVLTCRSAEKCQMAVDQINEENTGQNGSASWALLNLGSLASAYNLTQALSQDYPSIHYLFCNAGTTPKYSLTEDGLEDGFGSMHLAHMAVALGLLPSLRTAGETSGAPSRIVMVASEMAIAAAVGAFGPEPLFPSTGSDWRGELTRGDGTMGKSLPAYGRAKLCNVLLALELNRRLKDKKWPVIAHAVHSGAVVTKSSRESIKEVFRGIPGLPWIVDRVYFPIVWRSSDGGARVLLCAALAQEPPEIPRGGQYLDALCHPFLPSTEKEEDVLGKEGSTTLHFWGGKTLTFYKDPIQALQVADAKWSARLWNVSLALLQDSPANDLVQLAP